VLQLLPIEELLVRLLTEHGFEETQSREHLVTRTTQFVQELERHVCTARRRYSVHLCVDGAVRYTLPLGLPRLVIGNCTAPHALLLDLLALVRENRTVADGLLNLVRYFDCLYSASSHFNALAKVLGFDMIYSIRYSYP